MRTRDAITEPMFAIVDQICSYDWDGPRIRHLLLRVSSAMSDEVEAIFASRRPSEERARRRRSQEGRYRLRDRDDVRGRPAVDRPA